MLRYPEYCPVQRWQKLACNSSSSNKFTSWNEPHGVSNVMISQRPACLNSMILFFFLVLFFPLTELSRVLMVTNTIWIPVLILVLSLWLHLIKHHKDPQSRRHMPRAMHFRRLPLYMGVLALQNNWCRLGLSKASKAFFLALEKSLVLHLQLATFEVPYCTWQSKLCSASVYYCHQYYYESFKFKLTNIAVFPLVSTLHTHTSSSYDCLEHIKCCACTFCTSSYY